MDYSKLDSKLMFIICLTIIIGILLYKLLKVKVNIEGFQDNKEDTSDCTKYIKMSSTDYGELYSVLCDGKDEDSCTVTTNNKEYFLEKPKTK